jgi:signal transduction histidine kinase/CheY-like chemotaxis protein/HPt (histidine-containing phosphotransfer) domain-containing protein
MWRILLLMIFLFAIELSAEAQSIDNQLEKIQQQEDTTIALAQLSKLLENEDLNNSQRITILILQSRGYLTLSDLNNALIVIQQAKKLANQNNFLFKQAQVDKLTGIIFYFQGQYGQALLSYQAALQYFKKQPFSSDIAIKQANLLNNIALVQTAQGHALAALKSYQQAEPLYQKFGDEIDKIDVRYNLAVLYISLRRFDLSISMLKEVISKRLAINDNHGVAKASADIGVSYKYSGEYQKAEQYGLDALDYFQKNGNQLDAASQFLNIAEINYELSNLDKAHHYASRGIDVGKKMGYQAIYAGSLQTLAKIYFHQGDIEHSRTNVELSNVIAKKMGFQRLINENLGLISLIYAAENKPIKALTAQLSYQKAYLKLSNETLNEQIAQFESDQLTQQVNSLQQNKILQQLQSTKAEQQRQFTLLGVALLLVILFFIYRRHLESSLTRGLEDRVKKRTEALEFLTKELQDANMIKSQFLANMSHEIRTPLTAVIGQSEAIIYGNFDDVSIVKEVEIIHSNSLHLLQLINDILDLSKIEANKFELENRQQNLHEIVDKLNDIFTEQAQRKHLSFTITHRLPSPFIIDVDGLRLKQILINLCSNAIKFTNEGWVTLDIAIIEKTLFFTITDTGMGMNEAQLAKIFNSFTQADNSINRRFSGSGLGLFLSEQLAKLMLGQITVTSQIDQGSTFVFKLPFGDTYSTSVSIDSHFDRLSHESYNKKRYNGKVLLADDHDDNRRLIARLLSSLGLEVLSTSNGKEAIELCIKHKPILTLLDIQMPEMDGTQALTKLRDLGCTSPIYALTANAMSHEISQYLALGFDGHLKKPIERGAFLATIDQYYPEQLVTQEEQGNTFEDFDITDIKQSFIANLSQNKLDILQYSDNGNNESLARAAHKIAGAAELFGFVELSQSALELERSIKLKQIDAVEDLAHCLLDEIKVVQHMSKP